MLTVIKWTDILNMRTQREGEVVSAALIVTSDRLYTNVSWYKMKIGMKVRTKHISTFLKK